ncbi:MAG: ATP synthase F1 subunit epsilon [Candidatus Microsaccharimonas sossegonensis]|uniref:ATP synthase epsilon chain n=1 Tax=Candidatus Microsaccharimonas sossegonensis TaxID=2506948 RepID=A0A4Q0AI42_9BACT|nr:MAG: ATP synthase F1 subunit epsilon [Candidatus Microsaccharimonas sossegonensis]
MHLQLITLSGVSVDADIYEITAPTAAGPISIFPGHEALVSVAIPGALAVRYKKGDADTEREFFAISGGVIEVSHTAVRVLVDEADHGDDIIEAESHAALDRALKLRSEAKNQVDLEHAKELIDRHTVRLQVAGLRRHKRS